MASKSSHQTLIPPPPQQADGAAAQEGRDAHDEAARRVEGPLAPVQVATETAAHGLAASGPSAPPALGLLCVHVPFVQVREGERIP